MLEEENSILRERVIQLEEELGLAAQDFPIYLNLTPQELLCLGVLLKNKTPRMSSFMLAMYGEDASDVPDDKILDVLMCRIRKKLAEFGIEIGTVWGEGYFLTEPAKAKLRELIAA